MPEGVVEIDKYAVSIHSKGYPCSDTITLYRTNGTIAAVLNFYSDESTSPTNTVNSSFPSSGYAQISYPESAFASAIDVLRNEKPLYFHVHQLPNTTGSIRTSSEPIGEEEGI
jgi:hypothetical protein